MKLRGILAAVIVCGSALLGTTLLTGCDETDLINGLLASDGYSSSYDNGYYNDTSFDILDLKSGKARR